MASSRAAIKQMQVDSMSKELENIVHTINNRNNSIAIPTPVGTVMVYPTTGKIQLGGTVRNMYYPYSRNGVLQFIDEMICLLQR